MTFVRWPQIRSPGLGFPTGDIPELNAREVKTGVESKVYTLRLRPELQLVQSSIDVISLHQATSQVSEPGLSSHLSLLPDLDSLGRPTLQTLYLVCHLLFLVCLWAIPSDAQGSAPRNHFWWT